MAADVVNTALRKARQDCYDEEDAYWAGDAKKAAFDQPVNPRNEAAALSRLLVAKNDVCRGSIEAQRCLEELCNSYTQRVARDASGHTTMAAGQAFAQGTPEAELQSWCMQQGLQAAVHPAMFHGGTAGLRGLAASRDLKPGEAAITVPLSMLVSYDYVMASDLGKVLQRIPGLSTEAAAVVWTMAERSDAESALAPFWRSLPETLGTGLSAPQAAVMQGLPSGSPLHQEMQAARQHLREQHQALQPVYMTLCQAYPSYFKPAMFAWEQFLWAAELWYAYAISVQLPGGTLQPCLVPFVSLMNHSPLPHIVHFSRVDEATSTLRLLPFRPAAAGEEVSLSYGPLPNAKLLLFYGFTIPDNPFDSAVIPLKGGPNSDPQADIRQALLQASGIDPQQLRVRTLCGLPAELRSYARLLAASRKELLLLKKIKKADMRRELKKPLSPATEQAAMQLLHTSLQMLLDLYSASTPTQQDVQEQPGSAASGLDSDAGAQRRSQSADEQAVSLAQAGTSVGQAAEPGGNDGAATQGSVAFSSAGGSLPGPSPGVSTTAAATRPAIADGSGSAEPRPAAASSSSEISGAVCNDVAAQAFLAHARVWAEGQVQALTWALAEVAKFLEP